MKKKQPETAINDAPPRRMSGSRASTHSRLGFLLLLGDVCGGALPLQLQFPETHTHMQEEGGGKKRQTPTIIHWGSLRRLCIMQAMGGFTLSRWYTHKHLLLK